VRFWVVKSFRFYCLPMKYRKERRVSKGRASIFDSYLFARNFSSSSCSSRGVSGPYLENSIDQVDEC